MNPHFSLIVATLNRTDQVSELLTSLKNQSFKDFEVIIVDQNRDDRLSEIVRNYENDLRILRVKQTERGASKARNVGIKMASGVIVTFPDDDCEYPDDLLLSVKKIFDDDSEISGITLSSKSKHDDGSIARFSSKPGVINKLNILSRCIEAAIFVKSKALQGVFFDEEMGVGCSGPWGSDEGPDLVLRLINKGSKFVFFPDLLIYHDDPVKNYDDSAIQRSYKYGCGRGYYLRKHSYPFWFAMNVIGKYVIGILIGLMQFHLGKIKYYYSGLKGRTRGYFKGK